MAAKEHRNIMAKAAAADPAAALPEQKARKKFSRRSERKNVPHGVAFIQASFNNTIVTITDQ